MAHLLAFYLLYTKKVSKIQKFFEYRWKNFWISGILSSMDEGMTKRGDAPRWHFSHESLARFAYLLLAIYAIINWL
jgi:Ni,Fe-hydrogenase I cytochrome b subunit